MGNCLRTAESQEETSISHLLQQFRENNILDDATPTKQYDRRVHELLVNRSAVRQQLHDAPLYCTEIKGENGPKGRRKRTRLYVVRVTESLDVDSHARSHKLRHVQDVQGGPKNTVLKTITLSTQPIFIIFGTCTL